MPDPAQTVVASIRYEVRLLTGPVSFEFRSSPIVIDAGEDIPVIMRMTVMGTCIIEESVVGVIGSESRLDSREFLALRSFLLSGGVIGLNRDLL